jgi:hypothetical protein
MGVGKVKYIWDNQKKQLVLLVESDQMFSNEIRPLVYGNRLVLSSPFISVMDKPMRTHLLDRELREELETGIVDPGFTEVQLKTGNNYFVESCDILDPYLLKVILRYSPTIHQN